MRSFSRTGPISGILRLPEQGAAGLGRLGNVRWSLLLVALMLAVVGAATVHSASAALPANLRSSCASSSRFSSRVKKSRWLLMVVTRSCSVW